MLKRNVCLTIVGLLTCLTSLGASEPVQRYTLDYCYFTPLHQDKNHRGKVFAKLSSNGPVTRKLINFYLFNKKYKTGTTMSNLRPSDESGLISASVSNALVTYGDQNRFRLFFFDEDKRQTEVWFDEFFDDYYPHLKVDQFSNLTYEVNNVLGYTNEKGNFITSNAYHFKNWYALNDITTYNKFDVEMFSFEETFGHLYIPVEYSRIELKIPANYGLFSDLTDSERSSNSVVLSLKLLDKGDNHFVLSFNQNLFVNPQTYEMSRVERNNFVPTKYIYLPKNGFNDLGNLNFEINGEKLGTMHLDFEYHFSIEAQRRRIGDCVTSDYCVHVNDASFSDNGKELKHD